MDAPEMLQDYTILQLGLSETKINDIINFVNKCLNKY